MRKIDTIDSKLVQSQSDKKDKTAIIWVGDDPKDNQKISYKQLHQKVSRAANGL